MGNVCNIQRMCSHDGPGIRTTVFFKGCPLRCSWCHNPENICPKPENGWSAAKCIGCGACATACTRDCIRLSDQGVSIDHAHCIGCGECARACPSGALIWYGKTYSPEALCREIFKDRVYFKNSGGGITLSGGEPLMQPTFTSDILRICQREDIQTAVDTCCYAPSEIALEIAELADYMLIDLKHIDPALHKRFTGVDNALILDNICRVAALARAKGRPGIYIRTPLIPDCTLSEENIRGIGRFLRENLADVLIRWELLLFHNMCAVKYDELGREWAHRNTTPVTHTQLEDIRRLCAEVGLSEDQVQVSGLVMD